MTGTAMRPQLSPAMTVLKSQRFAFITEDAALRQCSQSSNMPSVRWSSWINGWTISTSSMAQIVMITKQKTKDQQSAFKQVDIMVTNLGSRVFKSV